MSKVSKYLRWGIVLLWVILVFVNSAGPQSAGAYSETCVECANRGVKASLTSLYVELRGKAGIDLSSAIFSPFTALLSDCPTTFEEQVILLINIERSNVGLPPLTLDIRLQSPARWFSNDLVVNGITNLADPHEDSNGDSPGERVTAAGYAWSWVGETIIFGSGGPNDTPEEVVQGWMASSPHRAILLHSTPTHIGVGYTHDPLGVPYQDVSVADFASLLSPSDPRQGPPSTCDPGFFQSHFPFITK
ncbi:MAG: CAP domain-containing protein [Chloroflexi bacterium]|nr:CAP domain-containing protein [Chloroflexota bacterium]